MARLPEFVQGTLGGVIAPFKDVQTELSLRKQMWAQVVDLVSDANRLLGIITVGTPIEISGPVTITGPVDVVDTWEVVTVSDVAANDSHKTLAVPSGYEYQVLWVWVEFVTDATALDRQLELRVHSASNDILFQMRVGAVQRWSQSRFYALAPALADLVVFRDQNYLMTPLPPTLFLTAGESIQVLDNNAVSPTGDDMIVHMKVARRVV